MLAATCTLLQLFFFIFFVFSNTEQGKKKFKKSLKNWAFISYVATEEENIYWKKYKNASMFFCLIENAPIQSKDFKKYV